MNFASLQFVYFLIVVLGAYLLVRRHEFQNSLLLLASYYFYASWDVRFLLLIWITTLASYFAGRAIGQSEDQRLRKRFLIAYAVFAMSILGYFKYFGFFLDSAQALLISLGIKVNPWHRGRQ